MALVPYEGNAMGSRSRRGPSVRWRRGALPEDYEAEDAEECDIVSIAGKELCKLAQKVPAAMVTGELAVDNDVAARRASLVNLIQFCHYNPSRVHHVWSAVQSGSLFSGPSGATSALAFDLEELAETPEDLDGTALAEVGQGAVDHCIARLDRCRQHHRHRHDLAFDDLHPSARRSSRRMY
jgi:hypothetical protein